MKTKIFKRMMACLLCVVMLSAGVQVASAAPGECTCTTKCFEHTINMECPICAHGQWMDCFGVLDIPEYTGDGTIDAASGSMQSADLMKTLIGALDKFDKITVILPSNAGEDTFNAIRSALNWAAKPGGSVDLTILGATAIPARAFESCGALGAFSAPQAESLGEFAFLVCLNLRTIHLPQVSSIGQYAFQNCNDLRTLTLGNVTSVNHGGFGIFHGVSSVNQIDLRLGHDQKELTKNGNYWQPTGNTLDTTSNSFVGYTFRSISTHFNAVLAYTANGNTITATCDCGYSGTATLSAPEGVVYDGTEKKIATVEYSDGWQSGELAVTYTNHINIGTATAKMTAGGATASTTFKINPANISYATVTFDPESGTYTGSAYTPNVTVTFNGATLVKDRDYTLSWDKSDITNADTYTVTVTGTGNFTGTKTAIFSIAPMELDETNTVVRLDQNTFVYDGTEHKPTVTVTFNGATLTEGVDYRVFYSRPMKVANGKIEKWFGDHTTSEECVNARDDYYAVVVGLGNFRTKDAFTLYANFVIEKATVTEPTITSKPYNKAIQKADVSETDRYIIEQNNGGENVGNYDVVLKLKDSANYTWSTTDNAEVTLQFKITQARNAWVTAPSISGWTYGEAANAPTAEAKFGTVYVLYDGTANDGTTYNGDTPPTKAGSYVARFFVDEAANYEPIGDGVPFTITKANQAAPAGLTKTDTTYFGKADGKISGLTSAMEFRKEGDSAYTAGFNGTLEYLAAGTYYIRYQGDANHNPSPDAVVTVNAGRKLQIVVPQNQVGYTVTVNKTEMEYEGSYTLKVEIHEGYTATEDFKIIISNWECGQQAGVEETYMNAIADRIIEVRGVADITPPAAEIKVKENKWTSFWNNLTFGLFFNETQDVMIAADDGGSGIKSIEYSLATSELELDEVRALTDWVAYSGPFKIEPNNHYIIYAKVTDHAGNTTYINSDSITLDNVAATLEGIEDGKTYYGDLIVIKSEEQFYDIKQVTLDGVPMGFAEGTYGLIPADNKDHTVVVEDNAGNKTTYTVTVYQNYTVTFKVDGQVLSTETVGYGQDATLPTIPAKEGYTQTAPVWDQDGKNIVADTEIHAVYTKDPVSSGPEPPQTGDNSHMLLWVALLFISCGAVVTLIVVHTKKRYTAKR